ncbi:tRNA wybutosine-synthesizing protein 2 homolog [Anabrus simplex]|uniref:tRNA wybutosine-synthesizing protein 2 homolog n=1 Tax=Anabrus simplex TaxID=316456 RepID=UPI0035A3C9A8
MELLVAVMDIKHCKLLKTEFERLKIINKSFHFKRYDTNICVPLIESAKADLLPYLLSGGTYIMNGASFCLQYEKSEDSYMPRSVLSSSDCLALQIKKLMRLRNIEGCENILHEIPKSWEKYGDLVMFDSRKCFSNTVWKELGEELWKCICSVLKVKRIAFKSRIQSDEFRSPCVHMVWGDSSWVHHVDNGIHYNWDVEKSMFCAGNAPERHRVSRLKCDEQVVVDMYAGIGYFTLPFILHGRAKLVHACEWNPYSVLALKISLQQNNVSDKCIIYEGDCLKLCPKGVADRVNLGLLPSSRVGWKTACAALRTTGGVLHIHENVVSGKSDKVPDTSDCGHLNVTESQTVCMTFCERCSYILKELDASYTREGILESFNYSQNSFHIVSSQVLEENPAMNIYWRNLEWKLWALHVCHSLFDNFVELYGENTPWKVSVKNLHHVKSYAPHIDHLVLDVCCIPL